MMTSDPRAQAQQGLMLLKEAILGILVQKTDGLSNAEIAELLVHPLRLPRIAKGLLVLVGSRPPAQRTKNSEKRQAVLPS